jgi:thiol-disulfide isomerase/thioredoxin
LLALAGGALGPRPAGAAEPVKLLKPEQYASRIVAPRKGRVLLVNFWATWCEPCREEMPALVRAAEGFKTKDLAVVLVSLDSLKTGPASVPKFLAASKIPFVCWLLKSRDPQVFIDTVDKSWDGSLPFTMIYGRDGKPAAKLAGQQTEKSFAEAIRKAIGS